MSTTQHTSHYNLPTFGDNPNDRPSWRGDFTDAMTKIDNQMYANATNVTTATAAANEAKEAANGVKESVSGAQSTADDAVARLDALGATGTTEAGQLKTKIDTTATDLGSFKTATNESISALQSRDTEIEGDLSATTSTANANKSDIAGIKANLTALHADSTANAGQLYNDIQKLKASGHLVIVGDSFSTEARQQVWWQQLSQYCKELTPHCYAAGGDGFLQGSITFAQQLDKAIADAAFTNDSVSHVIIYGGYNDWAYGKTADEVKTAVHDTYAKAVENFPKANVILCFGNIGMASGVEKYNTWQDWVKVVQSSLYTGGVPFVQSDLWLAGYTPTVFESDGLHPNNIGEGVICSHMAALIMGYQASGERLINSQGDPSSNNYWEMWYNDVTGLVHLYGKRSPTDVTGTGQQKLLDIGGYPPIIGSPNNPLFGCSWYMSGSQSGSVNCVTFSPVNKAIYVNLSKALTSPETLAVYFNVSYHV